MRAHSFYDPATGLFTGRTFATNIAADSDHAAALAANTPPGMAHAEGDHDHLSQRVDIERLAREDSDALTAWNGEAPAAT